MTMLQKKKPDAVPDANTCSITALIPTAVELMIDIRAPIGTNFTACLRSDGDVHDSYPILGWDAPPSKSWRCVKCYLPIEEKVKHDLPRCFYFRLNGPPRWPVWIDGCLRPPSPNR
ncbi:hypothetical protein EVAR_24261_1 [Eumeta japonica]|uniref:Uncharacterized protein n=1 Tax=Eumeta variegata TaxID=151549 RepID=A0A4C1VEU2_EUMVA|nr:hypothetical protein EVAR_24261_1 [Eumeta japonica]